MLRYKSFLALKKTFLFGDSIQFYSFIYNTEENFSFSCRVSNLFPIVRFVEMENSKRSNYRRRYFRSNMLLWVKVKWRRRHSFGFYEKFSSSLRRWERERFHWKDPLPLWTIPPIGSLKIIYKILAKRRKLIFSNEKLIWYLGADGLKFYFPRWYF